MLRKLDGESRDSASNGCYGGYKGCNIPNKLQDSGAGSFKDENEPFNQDATHLALGSRSKGAPASLNGQHGNAIAEFVSETHGSIHKCSTFTVLAN